MKVGLGSYACAWAIGVPGYEPSRPMDVFAFLETAASHGYRLVQIADNLPLHTLPASELMRLRRRAAELGLAVQVGTAGLTTANLERYLAIAVELGSPILRVVADAGDYQPEPDEVIDTLRSSLPAFRRAQVVVALENHDRFTTRTFCRILDTLADPNLGVCLDTVNSFGALEGPELVIDRLATYVVNLHVKDFAVRRLPHKMGFEVTGMPAGEGMLDVPRLLRRFSERPHVTGVLELWPPLEATVEDTIAGESRWLVRSTRFLQEIDAL